MILDTVIEQLEYELGITTFVHARDLDQNHSSSEGSSVGVREKMPVVTASVFKLPVLVEACIRMSTGEIPGGSRITLTPDDFPVMGGTGLAVFTDSVSLSFRDLCLSMMTVSDNRATDVVVDLLDRASINERMRDLGFTSTVLEGDCQHLFDTAAADMANLNPPVSYGADDSGDAWLKTRTLDPDRTNRSTPAETTALLAAIWNDDGIPAAACAEARRILGLQVWPHRLRRGFSDEVVVSGKTGTLPFVRNESGVVEFPEGDRYAVAVFLRTPSPLSINPRFDDAIADLAAAAIADLRSVRKLTQ